MKKFIISALAVTACACATVACGGDDAASPELPPIDPPPASNVTALPTLDFDGERLTDNTLKISTTNGSRILLPEFTAFDCYGNEMDTDAVEITHSYKGALDDSVTYNPGSNGKRYYAVGEHRFTFTVTDSGNPVLKSQYYVDLDVYQNVFSARDAKSVLTDTLTDNPKIKTNNLGFSLNFFDMDRSMVYYAEATFDCVDSDENENRNWGIGMFHAPDSDANVALKDYYYVYHSQKSDDGYSASWSHKFSHGFNGDSIIPSEYYTRKGVEDPKMFDGGDKIKVAVARIDETYYSFLNDELVETFVYSGFNGRRTSAGICLIGNDRFAYIGQAQQMHFYTGDKAKTKTLDLAEKSTTYSDFCIARITDEKYDNAAEITRDTVTFGAETPVVGDWWKYALRLNTLVGGKSLIEFDYELTERTGSGFVRFWMKNANGGSDPTNNWGFYNGISLCYFGNNAPGGADVMVNGQWVEGATEAQKQERYKLRYENFDQKQLFNPTTSKFRISILMEPIADEQGHTKFTYTLTELGVDSPATYSFSAFATQPKVSFVTEDEFSDFYYLSVMTEGAKIKISNVNVSSVRPF